MSPRTIFRHRSSSQVAFVFQENIRCGGNVKVMMKRRIIKERSSPQRLYREAKALPSPDFRGLSTLMAYSGRGREDQSTSLPSKAPLDV